MFHKRKFNKNCDFSTDLSTKCGYLSTGKFHIISLLFFDIFCILFSKNYGYLINVSMDYSVKYKFAFIRSALSDSLPLAPIISYHKRLRSFLPQFAVSFIIFLTCSALKNQAKWYSIYHLKHYSLIKITQIFVAATSFLRFIAFNLPRY